MEKDRFTGGAFHSELPGGKASGSLHLDDARLRFVSREGKAANLPYDGLRMRKGGAGGKLIFFDSPADPRWTFFTRDHSILAPEIWRREPDLAAQALALRKARIGAWVWGTSGLLLVLLLLAVLVVLKDPLVRAAAESIPASWENKLGNVALVQMGVESRAIRDPDVTTDLKELVGPLLGTLPDRGEGFHFYVVQDTMVNAFALPGGHVVLNTGLIRSADSASEVLGVLAHEIAHVTEKHSLQQILSTAGLFLVVQTLLGDISGLVAILADNGAFLLSRQFSREFEREADEIGWEYLVEANIHPGGLISFFRRLEEATPSQAEEDEMMQRVTGLLSTHPATTERIEALEKKLISLPPDSRFRSMEEVFQRLQNALPQSAGASS